MQIGIIMAALRKHRMATAIIVIEISLACAVLCNAISLVAERSRAIGIQSGVDESNLAVVQLAGFKPESAVDVNARVVQALRQISGVKSVGVVSAVPFGYPGIRAGVHLDQDLQRRGGVLDMYLADADALDALGLKLVAGRLPGPDEFGAVSGFVPANAPVLITRALANRYWPEEAAVGKSIWAMDTRFTVIGVVEHLAVTQPGGGEADGVDWSLVVPALPGPQFAGKYVVRASTTNIESVMRESRDAVLRVAPDVVFDEDWSRSVSSLREEYFRGARVMIALLIFVIGALLGATALGIVGLASYWVDQRRKHIGIRRALGATKGDIIRYFQIENFVIVTAGILVGSILAYGINVELMRLYELSRLSWLYFPLSAISMWVLGQLAVLAPALRASSISPVSAIRSI